MIDDLGGFLDSAGEDAADFAVFEHEETADGAAGGSRYIVAKRGGMAAGFLHHAGRTEHGLGDKIHGQIAREADADPGIGEGFHDEVHVGGARAAECSDGVEIVLFDFERLTDTVKDFFGKGEVGGLSVGSAAIDGDAVADEAGGVGHRADDGILSCEETLELVCADAGKDADEEGIGAKRCAFEFLDDTGGLAGFDGNDEDTCVGDERFVIARSNDAEALRDVLAARFGLGGGPGLSGSEKATVEDAFEEGRAHYAGPDDAEGAAGREKCVAHGYEFRGRGARADRWGVCPGVAVRIRLSKSCEAVGLG